MEEELSQSWFNISTGHYASFSSDATVASLVSFLGLGPGLPWWTGNEVRPSQESHSSDTKYCTVQKYTIAFTLKKM